MMTRYLALAFAFLSFQLVMQSDSDSSLLRVGCWNVCGVMSTVPYLTKFLHNVDILAITEHWLFPHSLNFLNSIDLNFTSFGVVDRALEVNADIVSARGQGGIAFLLRKSLASCVEFLNLGDDRVIGLKIDYAPSKSAFIFAVYLPPVNYAVDDYTDYITFLDDLYSTYSPVGDVIFLGDFNANLFGPRRPGFPVSTRDKALTQFATSCDLLPINLLNVCTGPIETFCAFSGQNKSTIDYILVPSNLEERLKSCKVLDDSALNLSDHYPILCYLNFQISHNQPIISHKARLAWSKLDTNCIKDSYTKSLSENLNRLALDEILSCPSDIDRFADKLINVMRDTAQECIPSSRFKPHLKPYWKDIRPFHKRAWELRNKWIEAGRPRGLQHESFRKYKESKCEFRRELRKRQRQAEREKYDFIENSLELDQSLFWRSVNLRRKNKNDTFPELKVNGMKISDPNDVVNAFANYFKTLYEPSEDEAFSADFKYKIDNKIRNLENDSRRNNDTIFREALSVEEIMRAIRKLKRGKAGGPDYITYEHIIFGGPSLVNYLLHLFNSIITIEYVPSSFKTAFLVPIFKGGDKNRFDPSNYRGISLLSSLQKLFELCISQRLQPWLEKKQIPHPLQAGYQPGQSNITTAFCILETIFHHVERRSKIFLCSLDVHKAFDSIWWNGLFHKLYLDGLNSKVRKILRTMFYGQECQIDLGMYVSHNYPIFQGVRQGSVLSTSLFLLYVNDLFKELENSDLGCYIGSSFVGSPSLADDISILTPTRSSCQKLLNLVCDYCSKWRLKLSVSKCKLLVFGETKRERHSQRNLLLYNSPITEVESITIVGMQISNTLSSMDRTLSACKKARRLINSLRSVGIGPFGLNPILSCEVWKRMCLPAALHTCELWSLTKTELVMLEKSQRYAAKIIQGLPIRTATDFALSTLGLISMEAYTDKCKLLFFGNLSFQLWPIQTLTWWLSGSGP